MQFANVDRWIKHELFISKDHGCNVRSIAVIRIREIVKKHQCSKYIISNRLWHYWTWITENAISSSQKYYHDGQSAKNGFDSRKKSHGIIVREDFNAATRNVHVYLQFCVGVVHRVIL